MCNISDIIEERGFSKGQYQEKHDLIASMLQRGKIPEEIHEFCQYPMQLILEIQKELKEKEMEPV